MKKQLILLFISILASLALSAEVVSEYYFRFLLHDYSKLEKITNIVSIDNIDEGYVYAYATPADLVEFRSLGYYPEILQHPGTLYKPIMSNAVDELREWDVYPTYDAYISIMYQFAADYPDICSVMSLGNTVEGREIMVAEISDNVDQQEAEPEFFYSSTMHGDETTGYILMLNLIEYLLSNYELDQQVTDLVNGVDIWITPLANPDGTYHGGNSTVFGATRFNANGVDLNRNFPDPAYGPHPDGNEWQPETIIMMDFAASRHITMGGNIHGGIEVINYPWDTWIELHPDDDWYYYTSVIYASSAQANSPAGYMTALNNGVTNGYAWYPAHGARQDYMNYFHNAREVTMELSYTKLLPENQLQNHWNYNREALLLYMEESLYGLHGIVTNELGEPLDARIFVLEHDDRHTEVYTDPELGDYHRLLAGGSYDIEYSSYGYRTSITEDLLIVDGETTNLDVVLETAPQFTVSGSVLNGNTMEPVADVTIELIDTPIEPVYTNANGLYQIENVFEGTYSVSIVSEGYTAIIENINVMEDNTEFDFTIFYSEIESFENGNFNDYAWSFGNETIWTIDNTNAFDGIFSARSGVINHNETTSLNIELNVSEISRLSFYSKVSSELGYDYFEFYIDDNQMNSWSGEIDWARQEYVISTGVHTFSWVYTKDGGVSSGSDCAWLDLIDFPCTSFVSASNTLQPVSVNLHGNYPNPFNPSTTISFSISSVEYLPTSLEIFNIRGQKIRTLVSESLSSGNYNIFWNGKNDQNKSAASGIYFYKLKTDDFESSGKMLMLK
ncbi:MAG: hypothetical protein DRI23_04240 [Candidatus Cloacimonadota bacterium]|nr:MAG: hypothetical protein DRI23_04240 [Candidatus Cloacimonadota bacterium]RLC52628.1 MAG: hypothetical protein DRH79_04670 [Candidatus Cloacimonadota bacterium]